MFVQRPPSLPSGAPAVRPRVWIAGMVVVFTVVFGVQFTLAYLQQKEENRRVVAEARDALSTAGAALESGAAAPAPTRPLPPGSSDAAKAGMFLRSTIQRMVAQRQAYERELDAAGWTRILDGARLQKDAGLVQSRAILERSKAVVAKYRGGIDELIAASKRELETMDVGDRMRASMREGFERAVPNSRRQADLMWSLEEQIIGEVEQAIALLAAKKASWRIEGGEIAFSRQPEMDAFNAHMARVQSIVSRQEQMQRESMERAQDLLKQAAK